MFQPSWGEEGGPILTVHMQAIELVIFKGVQTPPPPTRARCICLTCTVSTSEYLVLVVWLKKVILLNSKDSDEKPYDKTSK